MICIGNGYLGVCGKILLKRIFKKWNGRARNDYGWG
jgi:hypothetical protein